MNDGVVVEVTTLIDLKGIKADSALLDASSDANVEAIATSLGAAETTVCCCAELESALITMESGEFAREPAGEVPLKSTDDEANDEIELNVDDMVRTSIKR